MISLSSKYCGANALTFSSSLPLTMADTILTITGINGSQINVQVTLNVVCALAICREITSTSLPFGEIYCTNLLNTGITSKNTALPVILNTLCATAVLLAFLDCPIEASNAVIVVPMLSPNRIGIAPLRPITLVTPSAAGCDAKFCSTAIVAELLCTTSVMTAPNTTPSTGISDTLPIRSMNTGLLASGFITLPMISIPSNNKPKEKITLPISVTFSRLLKNDTINPIKIIG